jgi:uncharacterized RDD family membrane protein YckC
MHPYRLLARRFAAFLIDAVIVVALLRFVGALVARTAPSGRALPHHTLALEWVSLVVLVVGYWTVLVGRFGGTGGQLLLGLRVRRGAEPIAYRRQLLRCAVAPIAGLPLGLGYIWAILDRDYRTWVDLISRSDVVARHAATSALATVDDEPATTLMRAERIDVERMTVVATALEADGHKRAAAVLFHAIGAGRQAEALLARAAWLFAAAGDGESAITIAKQPFSDADARGLAHAAHALALAKVDAPDEARLELEVACASPFVAAQVEVEIALAERDLDAADTAAREVTNDAPASVDAWLVRARVAMRRDDLDDARASADAAVELAPHNVDARWARAQAIGPGRAWLHRIASRAELDALAAVLDADPQHMPARRRLRTATFGNRRATLGLAVVFGLYAALLLTLPDTDPPLAVALAGAALLLFVWNRAVHARLDGPAAKWTHYLDSLARLDQHRRGGRTVPLSAVREAAPRASVLHNPARCTCATLQHVYGTFAVQYARLHLVEVQAAPAPGVYVMKCPHDLAAYVAVDGNVVDDTAGAQLFRVSLEWFDTADTGNHGMYL